jgi:hypothetical protein
MKAGAENRKKTITLGVLGAVAVCGLLYNLGSFFGGSSTPPPAIAPVSNTPAPVRPSAAGGVAATARAGAATGGSAAIPGVAADRIASNSQSLDPTLNQAAMLRTEELVYTGSGRNIFSATLFVPPPAIPKNVPPPRPNPVNRPIQPVNQGPPPPPPIPLKFFGTAQRAGKPRQVFLLSGNDVYLAEQGDIVAKRYKILLITSFTVSITDLTNNNTQTLPLQQQ